jgi:hypothetical protein
MQPGPSLGCCPSSLSTGQWKCPFLPAQGEGWRTVHPRVAGAPSVVDWPTESLTTLSLGTHLSLSTCSTSWWPPAHTCYGVYVMWQGSPHLSAGPVPCEDWKEQRLYSWVGRGRTQPPLLGLYHTSLRQVLYGTLWSHGLICKNGQ